MKKTKKLVVRTFGRIVVGHLPITIECNTYLTLLNSFERLPIQLGGMGMGKDQVVANTEMNLSLAVLKVGNQTNPHPGFRGGVAFG